MKCIVWNCQGAGGRAFHRVFNNLIHSHKPAIVGLVEPKVSGSQANAICTKLGFPNWVRVEAVGFSGGIWVFWSDVVNVYVLYTHPQFVLLQVTEGTQACWFYAIVYGSPTHHLRRHLWNELVMTKRGLTGPLLVAGDFNSVLTQDETSNYSAFSLQRCTDFVDWVHAEGLIDMGFNGPNLTWVKSDQSGYAKGARLDRALCNISWRHRFLGATVMHLPRIASDHAPILVQTETSAPYGTNIAFPFRFQTAWLPDDRWAAVVRDSWQPNRQFNENILASSDALSIWNKSIFGNIMLHKRIILTHIAGVQRRFTKVMSSHQRTGSRTVLGSKTGNSTGDWFNSICDYGLTWIFNSEAAGVVELHGKRDYWDEEKGLPSTFTWIRGLPQLCWALFMIIGECQYPDVHNTNRFPTSGTVVGVRRGSIRRWTSLGLLCIGKMDRRRTMRLQLEHQSPLLRLKLVMSDRLDDYTVAFLLKSAICVLGRGYSVLIGIPGQCRVVVWAQTFGRVLGNCILVAECLSCSNSCDDYIKVWRGCDLDCMDGSIQPRLNGFTGWWDNGRIDKSEGQFFKGMRIVPLAPKELADLVEAFKFLGLNRHKPRLDELNLMAVALLR
nr:uncharacterized protein LOC109159904 [Ipomoea batatas]